MEVGARVESGQVIGGLGNSGLSDVPHLHFEVGVKASPMAACDPPQNFDTVYNPAKLTYAAR